MSAIREERDPQFEQQLTRWLAEGLSVDVEPLIVHAQWRADKAEAEYGKGFPDASRDLVKEAIEELLDCRNYIVWKLEQIHRSDDDSASTDPLQSAMRHVILAFEDLRRAI